MTPLILGAGPAGCAAAIALARSGAHPLIVERAEEVGDPLCGGFLSWKTASWLENLGINCAKLGAHRVDVLALFGGDKTAEIPLPAPAFGLSRHALDRALRTRAQAEGVEIAHDVIRSIDGQIAIGRRREWSGGGLFLACGKYDIRGLVRPRRAADPALGLRLRLPPSAERQRLLAGRIELHLFAGGYAGVVLQEDGSANICLAVQKSLLGRTCGDPRVLIALLGERSDAFAARLGDELPRARIETIGAVPYGWLARDTAPGVFRLGDQAAVMPSLAGEGIAIALASGEMAARYWLGHGPKAARRYQHAFAARAAIPLAAGRFAGRVAEGRVASRVGLAIARRAPQLVQLAMEGTRLRGGASTCVLQHRSVRRRAT